MRSWGREKRLYMNLQGKKVRVIANLVTGEKCEELIEQFQNAVKEEQINTLKRSMRERLAKQGKIVEDWKIVPLN